MLPPSIVTAGQLVCGVRCAGALQCIHINWMNYVLQLTFIKSNFSHSFIIKFYYQITMINWTLSTRSSHNPDSTKKKKSKNRIKQSLSKYDRKFWILFNANPKYRALPSCSLSRYSVPVLTIRGNLQFNTCRRFNS